MRDIRFRAWEIMGQRMLVDNGNLMIDTLHGGAWWHYGYELKPVNDVILMQYTGLKDKNGKDVYEGDILEEHGKGQADPFVVKEIIPIKRDLYLSPKEDDWLSWPEMYEIIGNIYENKDLLK